MHWKQFNNVLSIYKTYQNIIKKTHKAEWNSWEQNRKNNKFSVFVIFSEYWNDCRVQNHCRKGILLYYEISFTISLYKWFNVFAFCFLRKGLHFYYNCNLGSYFKTKNWFHVTKYKLKTSRQFLNLISHLIIQSVWRSKW